MSYIILETEPSSEQFAASSTPLLEVGGKFISRARRSLDRTKTILEVSDPPPGCFSGLAVLSHGEALEAMLGSEWMEPLP